MCTRLRKATGVQPESVARVQLLSETVQLGRVHRVYPFVIAGAASTLETLLWVNRLSLALSWQSASGLCRERFIRQVLLKMPLVCSGPDNLMAHKCIVGKGNWRQGEDANAEKSQRMPGGERLNKFIVLSVFVSFTTRRYTFSLEILDWIPATAFEIMAAQTDSFRLYFTKRDNYFAKSWQWLTHKHKRKAIVTSQRTESTLNL